MRFRTFQFIVAIIFTFILMKIVNHWQLEWYKVGVPYLLGMAAMMLVSAEPRRKRPTHEVIGDMEREILDAMENKPQSAAEILDYITRCKQFCKDNDI